MRGVFLKASTNLFIPHGFMVLHSNTSTRTNQEGALVYDTSSLVESPGNIVLIIRNLLGVHPSLKK